MSKEVQSMLFTRFFSTKQSDGTGLGLSVAKKIAVEHGGSLEFESEPGKGSAFHIRLPLSGE
jgi:signal transduction histidine kinase